ncbi:sensor histidine kinase [Roseivirga thermotolerans]|uniref:histidine kinase n=1 Tax=Roseivirga thermotolerans TaxID=1758176 RepID=A0ABQ3I348_9BACT|nr:sensor histidine kinase [Roseivirga thermotolerans]GHE50297.1 hypothetical protein GCM10011340_00090 [Roseivirga thermotolerans]
MSCTSPFFKSTLPFFILLCLAFPNFASAGSEPTPAQNSIVQVQQDTSYTAIGPFEEPYLNQQTLAFQGDTDLRSLLLGSFYGLMVVMILYNFFIYLSLKDRVYLLYVFSTTFAMLTTVSTNGLGEQYLWPQHEGIDGNLYVLFAGISMAFSSRFAAEFLNVASFSRSMDRLLWLICGLSLLMSVLCALFGVNPIYGFARWLVLLSFPTLLVAGIFVYRKGFKPALFYIIAWVPYILGVLIRTIHGAGLLPTNFFTLTAVELGGAMEVTLLSLALADRIRRMRKELRQQEIEKERFKLSLLEEQKLLLEKTVEERTKALQEANETKDKFFSIIAHDLRSPMVALQGVGQKLEYYIRKNRQEKLLELGTKIDNSTDHINHLLNNLLNWATTQKGSIPYHPEKVSLYEMVQETIRLYESLAISKEIEVMNEVSEEALAYVDVNTMATVVRNLLSNAIKFSPEGSTIWCRSMQADKMLLLQVKDQGVGMSDEKIREVLNGQRLISPAGVRGEKGFGLGLRLSKEFINLNRGRFEVTSRVSEGTTFSVYLPLG